MKVDDFLDNFLGGERRDLIKKKRLIANDLTKLESHLRNGELELAERILARLEANLTKQLESLADLKKKIPEYRVQEYLQKAFDEEFKAACQAQELKIEGSFPAYEVFPLQVRILPEKRAVEINDKTVYILRPKALAGYLKAQIAGLYKERFNPKTFIDTLEMIYDTILDVKKARYKTEIQNDLDVLLVDIYNRLTPLPSQRRHYPKNMFAFDLHRLFLTDTFTASDGRELKLGDTRLHGKSFTIYDANGRELRFGGIRFIGGA